MCQASAISKDPDVLKRVEHCSKTINASLLLLLYPDKKKSCIKLGFLIFTALGIFFFFGNEGGGNSNRA